MRKGWKMSANGLHQIRWRRVAVARVHRTAARQFARDLVNIPQVIAERVENVANGLHQIRRRRVAVARVHRTATRQFARDLVNIPQVIAEGVENVGKRTPSDSMETSCRGKSPSDRRERLSKYTARYR